MYEWFAQDGWKVNAKLRVEVGLRHTITAALLQSLEQLAVFDPAAYNPANRVQQDPKTGFILEPAELQRSGFSGQRLAVLRYRPLSRFHLRSIQQPLRKLAPRIC